jgi:asparagine synthase (glutamine-hydrolysing)
MSTIFGIFYRDGRPVSDELETMYSGMAHFPHERHAFLKRGNVGLGQMLTFNTPEAVGEAMPRYIPEAKLLFVAEGRIDNRGELFEALGVPGGERAAMPDGDLILQAYLKWGEKCVDHLEGKWSLAAFHEESQRLFLARDKWDYTALEYYADERVFAFSTSSKGLLPLPIVRREIDEIMVARLLVVWPGEPEKTYFKDVLRLLPSHHARVTRETLALSRYWDYKDIPVRGGRTLEECCGELLENMERAVAARLRSYAPVAATLSGGMDSSTVCTLAAEHLARTGGRLRTYTHVPRFSPSSQLRESQFGDERPFVEAVVRKCGNIDPVFLISSEISPMEVIREALRLFGEPFHAAGNAYWIVDIFLTAARDGNGTVLMGEFGNATTSWTGNEDALPALEIVRRRGLWSLAKKKIAKPLLYGRGPVSRLYKRIAFGSRPWGHISFMNPEQEKKLDLAGKIRRSGFDPTFKRYYRDPKAEPRMIFDFNVLRLPYGAQIGCETGLELRDPTGDPRVIASALSIPDEMFLGPMNKWVLRTMMNGKLPDQVRLNQRKGKQSSDLAARLCANSEELDRELAEMETDGFGRIADMERIRREWELLKSDSAHYPLDTAFHFLRPVAAHLYYRMNASR